MQNEKTIKIRVKVSPFMTETEKQKILDLIRHTIEDNNKSIETYAHVKNIWFANK